MQEAREACGGQGIRSDNRIGQLKAEHDVMATFEGDNNVLMQTVRPRKHIPKPPKTQNPNTLKPPNPKIPKLQSTKTPKPQNPKIRKLYHLEEQP